MSQQMLVHGWSMKSIIWNVMRIWENTTYGIMATIGAVLLQPRPSFSSVLRYVHAYMGGSVGLLSWSARWGGSIHNIFLCLEEKAEQYAFLQCHGCYGSTYLSGVLGRCEWSGRDRASTPQAGLKRLQHRFGVYSNEELASNRSPHFEIFATQSFIQDIQEILKIKDNLS